MISIQIEDGDRRCGYCHALNIMVGASKALGGRSRGCMYGAGGYASGYAGRALGPMYGVGGGYGEGAPLRTRREEAGDVGDGGYCMLESAGGGI